MKRPAFLAACALVLATRAVPAAMWPTETDRLAHQLESADASERRAAAMKLGSLPLHLATPLVTTALGDPDIDVRLAGAQAALALRVTSARDAVVPWLNEPDARLRLAACQVLRATPSPLANGPLARVLGDADARVREAAAQALGNAGSTDAVVALLGHIDDPSPEVRVAVVDALYRLGDPRAVVPLGGKIGDTAPEVRKAVARALGELGVKSASSPLMVALRDPSREVRIEALSALGTLGDPGSVLAIAPLASVGNPPEIRRAALSAMGRIGGEKALSILIGALDQDEVGAGRAPARDALVAMGEGAEPALVAALASPSSETSASYAAEALGALHAKAGRQAITSALAKGVLPKSPALRALASLGDPAALPTALELLSDRSANVRAEARRTADALFDPRTTHGEAIDPLLQALNDERTTTDERAQLLRLLGETKASRAAPTIAGLAGASSLAIRLAAIDALGELGPDGDDGPLMKALDDENPLVRARAGASLARAAKEATTQALLDRIGSAEQQDRTALATALAGALGRVKAEATIDRAVKLAATSDGKMRDALLQGLGTNDAVKPDLGSFATSLFAADRRKAAESLAGHVAALPALRELAKDYDAGVRANAMWSLGSVGDASDLTLLVAALSDSSTAVAADAAVSLGIVSARVNKIDDAAKALCAALADGRSYVRTGALSGLLVAKTRCADDGESERALLASDPSPTARSRAADLLHAVPSKQPDRDRRALSRCRMEDPYGSVAQHCAAVSPVSDGTEPVTVLVVPEARATPDPDAPFALLLANGTIRHGTTDRRGAAFERAAPRGSVALLVPAPFAR